MIVDKFLVSEWTRTALFLCLRRRLARGNVVMTPDNAESFGRAARRQDAGGGGIEPCACCNPLCFIGDFNYHNHSDIPSGKKPADKSHGNGANLGLPPKWIMSG